MENTNQKKKLAELNDDSVVPITTSIKKINKDWITKHRGKTSELLNAAIDWLRLITDEVEDYNEVVFGLRMSKYGKIEGFRSGSVETRTRDLRHVKTIQNSVSDCRNGADIYDVENSENFYPPAEIAVVSVAEYVKPMRDEYMVWCKKTGITTDATADNYYTSLLRMDDVRTPADLSDYAEHHNGKALTDKQRKGLLKLFKYRETREYKTDFNGIPLEVWRANLRISDKAESRMAGRVKDLTDEEVIAAREMLPKDIAFYFSLLAYSGARHTHLYRALKEKRELHHAGDNVIYMDVADLSSGKKYESRFYFPAELEEGIKKFEVKRAGSYYQERLGAGSDEDRPVNAASLRKWHYTWMLTHGVDSIAADQVQGRVPKGVGASHYADPVKLGEKAYCEFVAELVDTIPLPEL